MTGTLGKAMIEGRISAGVVIGNNSDLGGGCSTMGTLSGGNDIKISVGKKLSTWSKLRYWNTLR